MKVVVLFSRFGPYHIARLNAAGSFLKRLRGLVIGIEVAGSDEASFYYWGDDYAARTYEHHTLFPEQDYTSIATEDIIQGIENLLNTIRPDVVAINGWSFTEAQAALTWCLSTDTPRILLSTSQHFDYERTFWKEWIKRGLVAAFQSGFVGGVTHRAYLERLGMPADQIVLGYNAVDNAYFDRSAETIRAEAEVQRAHANLPNAYFLVVGRFIPEKNLARLLRVFATYRKQVPAAKGRDLVLVGDGPLRESLEAYAEKLAIKKSVHFVGFVQYDGLPCFYALADALLLPSLKDTWGLVVNEAMASGTPVVVSQACGCAAHLVEPGMNGYVIDPEDENQLLSVLLKLSSLSLEKSVAMRESARRIIQDWGPDRFAKGLWKAAQIALRRKDRRVSPMARLVLRVNRRMMGQ